LCYIFRGSKEESHAQAFTDRGIPHGKIFRFEHNLEGLASVQDLESITGLRPAVVLEASIHYYHSPVIHFLDEHQYLYNVINHLFSHQAKKTSLRKVKTDLADAYQLGKLFMMNLRYLTRQHDSLTDMYVQVKLQFQAVLDQIFPEYRGEFGDLYSKVSLRS
jgi:transposase